MAERPTRLLGENPVADILGFPPEPIETPHRILNEVFLLLMDEIEISSEVLTINRSAQSGRLPALGRGGPGTLAWEFWGLTFHAYPATLGLSFPVYNARNLVNHRKWFGDKSTESPSTPKCWHARVRGGGA